MSGLRALKVASVVLAIHLIVLGFFFFKPPLNYFAAVGLSTIIVWPAAFTLSKRRRWVGVVAGFLVQVGIQQLAYAAWVNGSATAWWALGQFLGLQYVVMIRFASPEE